MLRTPLPSLLAILLLGALAGGCVPVPIVVAAAATGGYLAGKDERSLEQISKDATITASVKAALLRDPDVHALAIDVDTYQSIVTLKGEVGSEAERQLAGKIASKVNGVKEVRLDLKIVSAHVEERA